jgi:putative membrane protein
MAFVQLLVVVAGLVHFYIFVMESVRFDDPKVHRGTFRVAESDVEAVRPWAYNQGFYNLFLGIGAFTGATLVRTQPEAGWALILMSCGSMVAAAVILVGRDQSMARAALAQGLFPALALLASLTQL